MANLSWSTNGTTALDGDVIITWNKAIIILITVPLSVITILGNVLVIISFQINPLLRTVSNYLLLSLAVADLIVGTISMNLYTTYILIGHWILGSLACDIWLAVDYVASNASVLNLLAISFDRYLSITRPLTYRVSRTTRRAVLLIALAWGISFVLWAPAIMLWQYIVGQRTVPDDQCLVQFLSEPVVTFGTAIAAFYLPVSVMVVLYWRVYQETERRSKMLTELMASHGGDSNQLSQSSSNYLSDIKETVHQPEGTGRSHLCPSITHCWKKKRENPHIYLPSQTNGHPQTDKSPLYIPLSQLKRVDSLSDSDFEKNVDMENCQPDTQQSLGQYHDEASGDSQVAVQRNHKTSSWSLIKEKKAARTLCTILLAFIVTWTPYNIMVLVSTFCDCVPERFWQLGYWLCYVNSTVNPICYALCNKRFRETFKALLLCRWRNQRSRTRYTFSQHR